MLGLEEVSQVLAHDTKVESTSDSHAGGGAVANAGNAVGLGHEVGNAQPAQPTPPPPVPHLAEVTAALTTLAGLPIADLERLLSETLDLCSHRFDAWITSLATARLSELRANADQQGTHFGAFGWVQNLRPAATAFDPGAGGFIHAPSPNHAQAAAILRNGYLARGTAGTPLYAIDLSSAQVRAGLAILERIRDGESLSEILGTELETRLRADAALAVTFLEPLRSTYPTPSSPIIDGVAAVLAWRANPSSPKFPTAVLSVVSQLLDAAGDLLIAESVYQTVRGNPSAAAAGLDALGQGCGHQNPRSRMRPLPGARCRIAWPWCWTTRRGRVGRLRRRLARPPAGTSTDGSANFSATQRG